MTKTIFYFLLFCSVVFSADVDLTQSRKVLGDLETTLKELQGLKDEHRARLLSLIHEMNGDFHYAYMSLKQLKEEPSQDRWRLFRELYLAERLGLEEEKARLAPIMIQKYENQLFALSEIHFCSKVESFGVYEEIKSPLSSGSLVLIYVEVKGVQQREGKGESKYLSGMDGFFEVLDADEKSIFRIAESQSFDYASKSPLKDYYIWIKWKPYLMVGEYTLRVHLKDQSSSKTTSRDLSFSIR